MSDILYPWALDMAGDVAFAATCSRGHYVCGGCYQPMVLRRGDVRAPHFAHAHGIGACTEGIAAINIAKSIIAQISESTGIHVLCRCAKCYSKSSSLVEYPRHAAAIDYVSGSYSASVGMIGADGLPILMVAVSAVVIRNNSPVWTRDIGMIANLAASGVPWVEVQADAVINASGALRPLQSSPGFVVDCESCKNATELAERDRRRAEEYRRQQRILRERAEREAKEERDRRYAEAKAEAEAEEARWRERQRIAEREALNLRASLRSKHKLPNGLEISQGAVVSGPRVLCVKTSVGWYVYTGHQSLRIDDGGEKAVPVCRENGVTLKCHGCGSVGAFFINSDGSGTSVAQCDAMADASGWVRTSDFGDRITMAATCKACVQSGVAVQTSDELIREAKAKAKAAKKEQMQLFRGAP